jgi:hypothetical protein
MSGKLLVSLASALAMEPSRTCWRALQEMVAGDRPGTLARLVAKQLNISGDGEDCWRPSPFHLTGANVRALADALASEPSCSKFFREMVEETIPDVRAMQREIAEEN